MGFGLASSLSFFFTKVFLRLKTAEKQPTFHLRIVGCIMSYSLTTPRTLPQQYTLSVERNGIGLYAVLCEIKHLLPNSLM